MSLEIDRARDRAEVPQLESGDLTMKNTLRSVRDERPALRKALESAGYLVLEASVGTRDIESLRVLWAALIQFDLPMPRVGGLEVFRRLRDTGDIDPVVIILTHDRVPETIEAVRLGLVDVLVRPLKAEALRTVVEEIIRRAASPRPVSDWAQQRIFVAVQPSMIEQLRVKRAIDSLGSRCGNPESLDSASRKAMDREETAADARGTSN